MPTNYPAALDTATQLPTTRADSTPLTTNHPSDHDTVNGAALALETKLGIGSSTPIADSYFTGNGTGSSVWVIYGSMPAAKTTAYTALATDVFIPADATGGAFNVTLPNATALTFSTRITIKRINSGANVVTVVGTVDGQTNYPLNQQWSSITVRPVTGSNAWYIE